MITIFEPRYEWLDRVDSTNTVCMKKAQEGEPEGYTVAAFFQEQGRGQRGNSWESEEGKNLTFSLLLRPSFLKVEEQFSLSKVVALSICDWIEMQGVKAKIKWPNDIYVDDKKIAGILIENNFSGSALDVSVIGIGLNLNQEVFPADLPNPTSMWQLTNKQYRPEIVLSELVVSIQMRYLQLRYGLRNKVDEDYLTSLYRINESFFYSDSTGRFRAKVIDVKPTGELILKSESGEIKSFGFKEVNFEI